MGRGSGGWRHEVGERTGGGVRPVVGLGHGGAGSSVARAAFGHRRRGV
jgi:hypothetical protein